jgi:hypothetical protein
VYSRPQRVDPRIKLQWSIAQRTLEAIHEENPAKVYGYPIAVVLRKKDPHHAVLRQGEARAANAKHSLRQLPSEELLLVPVVTLTRPSFSIRPLGDVLHYHPSLSHFAMQISAVLCLLLLENPVITAHLLKKVR